jgi:uncharacterized protein
MLDFIGAPERASPFTLTLRNEAGERFRYGYDPHTSELTTPDGVPVITDKPSRTWPTVARVSPENPGLKSSDIKRLKIQLGLGCNYSCGYCLQSAEIHKASSTSVRDAEIFLQTLGTWLKSAPARIEFWGGEPLLYWHKIKVLAPALRQRFPDAKFVLITNGSLLNQQIINGLDAWQFSVAISHDGPGQHVRGPDPLDDPRQRFEIEKLMAMLVPKGRFSFNAVLTPASHDVNAVIDWFEARFGAGVPVNFEGVVHDYGGDESARFKPAQLSALTHDLALQIINGGALRSNGLADRVQRAIDSIVEGRPSSALSQKCGMDQDGAIAVDLLGNVSTCQNVGGEGEHRIGHVRSLDKVRLTTAWHWSHRQECSSCPVLQLCAGSCMYQSGAGWVNSCNAEFAFNLAILAGAIFYITGLALERVDGPMVRPGLAA